MCLSFSGHLKQQIISFFNPKSFASFSGNSNLSLCCDFCDSHKYLILFPYNNKYSYYLEYPYKFINASIIAYCQKRATADLPRDGKPIREVRKQNMGV